MKRTIVQTISLFLVFLLFLSGCGASGSSVNDMFQTSDKMEYDSGWDEAPSLDAEVKEESSSQLTENDLANRKMIKTVNLTLQTKEFDTLKNDLEETIPAYGGYIQDSNFYAPQREGRYRSYSLTVRIPVEHLDDFVHQVGLLGTLTNKTEQVEDVTLTYIDMTAYKEALEVEYDKILELLEKAVDLDQILILESKLSELRYEINSYESKLRTYDNLVSYSTVYINISEVEYEIAVKDTIGDRIRATFTQSLYDVRDFFVDILVFVVGNLPVLLVVAVFLTIFFLLAKKLLKRKFAKHPAKKQGKLNKTASTKEEGNDI